MMKILKTEESKGLVREFGFANEQEFIDAAVQEKMRALKGLLFAKTTAKVRLGLKRSGVSQEAVLRDFERKRRRA